MFPLHLSPQALENTAICSVFFNFSMFYNAGGQVKHVYKKSFQNFVFHSAFTLFPVKNMVINTYTFFARKSVQDTAFAVFSMLWLSKAFSKYRYLLFFYQFWPLFHCRKRTKITFQYLLKLTDTQNQGNDFPGMGSFQLGSFFHFSLPWGLPKLGNFE